MRAAWQYDPQETVGLDGALAKIARADYGPWLLGLTAVGLFCYGLFCFAEARWREVEPDGASEPTAAPAIAPRPPRRLAREVRYRRRHERTTIEHVESEADAAAAEEAAPRRLCTTLADQLASRNGLDLEREGKAIFVKAAARHRAGLSRVEFESGDDGSELEMARAAGSAPPASGRHEQVEHPGHDLEAHRGGAGQLAVDLDGQRLLRRRPSTRAHAP